ncbi:MAG: NADH-quinone oxidoreductase subunit F [Planctomycetota bacterium]|jgi:NADH-quinone oxidoreductase subunit F
MTTTAEILDEWRDQPAPLLGILHAFHERDQRITEEAILAIAESLRIPKAELYGTVSFYDHFSMESGSQDDLRICTGPICALRGSREILEACKPQGARSMPCSGRCDIPIPALKGNATLDATGGSFTPRPSTPLPSKIKSKFEECVFAAIREPGRNTLDGYQKTGGYAALSKALSSMTPEGILEEVSASGLAGRGGAGFPTGVKWRAVAEAPGNPKYIVCNADEGEPGCFKDRAIMDYDPHAMLEGMIIAGRAAGASLGFIYLRYEYPETMKLLERALQEARDAGFLGENICNSGFSFDILLRRGAGAYICGEETSLLNSLEGKHPFPRNRPPYPVTHGFNDLPTAVNNVETLAGVPWIIAHGAEKYQALGLGDNKGTKLISLSGDIKRPGNYEVPLGLPLKTLIEEWAGGVANGETLQAVSMAGLSGGFLGAEEAMSATLDEKSIRSFGSFLGAGGIMVFDQTRDMIDVGKQAMSFFAHESCGKCFPCRIGTQRLMERLDGDSGPKDFSLWREEVEDIGSVMKSSSACGLGMAAPLITESLLRLIPEQLTNHATGGNS